MGIPSLVIRYSSGSGRGLPRSLRHVLPRAALALALELAVVGNASGPGSLGYVAAQPSPSPSPVAALKPPTPSPPPSSAMAGPVPTVSASTVANVRKNYAVVVLGDHPAGYWPIQDKAQVTAQADGTTGALSLGYVGRHSPAPAPFVDRPDTN